tara:strand:- start:366 stop:488 length:123 start_codon:yes stop_codon:yes gene_type:complete
MWREVREREGSGGGDEEAIENVEKHHEYKIIKLVSNSVRG